MQRAHGRYPGRIPLFSAGAILQTLWQGKQTTFWLAMHTGGSNIGFFAIFISFRQDNRTSGDCFLRWKPSILTAVSGLLLKASALLRRRGIQLQPCPCRQAPWRQCGKNVRRGNCYEILPQINRHIPAWIVIFIGYGEAVTSK